MGYAALSRVFPLFALAGASLGLVGRAVGGRSVNRTAVRLLMGAAVTAAVLVPCSAAARRGDIWSAFVRNLAKHTSVPSPNRMGLATLLSFDGASTSAKTRGTVPTMRAGAGKPRRRRRSSTVAWPQ